MKVENLAGGIAKISANILEMRALFETLDYLCRGSPPKDFMSLMGYDLDDVTEVFEELRQHRPTFDPGSRAARLMNAVSDASKRRHHSNEAEYEGMKVVRKSDDLIEMTVADREKNIFANCVNYLFHRHPPSFHTYTGGSAREAEAIIDALKPTNVVSLDS